MQQHTLLQQLRIAEPIDYKVYYADRIAQKGLNELYISYMIG
jgi:hypothetical protein